MKKVFALSSSTFIFYQPDANFARSILSELYNFFKDFLYKMRMNSSKKLFTAK